MGNQAGTDSFVAHAMKMGLVLWKGGIAHRILSIPKIKHELPSITFDADGSAMCHPQH